MLRLPLLVIALGCILVCAVAGMATGLDLFARVNERLPPEARLSFSRRNNDRAWRAYRQLYPDGPLLGRMRILRLVAAAAVVVVFVCLLLPRG